MRRGVRIGAVVGLVAGALLILGAPSRAASIDSGWWWKANVGQTTAAPSPVPNQPLPVAPPAPPVPPTTDGGLLVGATPDGALAIAAIRTEAAATSITLRVAPNGDSAGQVAHLLACTINTPWVPEQGGRWDNKPFVACDAPQGGASVAGIRSQDGKTWTFPVAPLSTSEGTSIGIVPTTDGALPNGLLEPFQLTFVRPVASDITFAPVASTSDDYVPPAPDDVSVGGVFDFNDANPFTTTDQPIRSLVSPALPQRDQAPTISPVVAVTVNRHSGRQQAAGMVVVLVSLGLLLATSRQPTPAVQGLIAVHGIDRVPDAPELTGGVGRFIRPRSGTPPSLH